MVDNFNFIVSKNGDGDFNSITEALANAKDGDKIFVKGGKYEESIVIDKAVLLSGDKDDIPEIFSNSGVVCEAAYYAVKDVEELTIENIHFSNCYDPESDESDEQDDSEDNIWSVVYIHGACTLRNCSVSNSYCRGILVNGCLLMENCDIYENKESGIFLSGLLESHFIKNCKFHNNGKEGIVSYTDSDGTIIDCDIYENGKTNIYLAAASDIEIENCKVHNSNEAGIIVLDVSGEPIKPSNSKYNIKNCDIYENKSANVCTFDKVKPIIEDCKIHNGEDAGLFIREYSEPIIKNCDIYENESDNIAVTHEAKPFIENCKIHNSEDKGLLFSDNAKGTVKNCDIYNNFYSNIMVEDEGDPFVKNCISHDAVDSYGIRIVNHGKGTFENCDVYRNGVSNIVVEDYGNPLVKNCRSHSNEKNVGLGVLDNGTGTFINCDIYDNGMQNVIVKGRGNPLIENTIIRGSDNGGIVTWNNATGTYRNCKIYGNCAGNIFANGDSHPFFENCDIKNVVTLYGVRVEKSAKLHMKNCNISEKSCYAINVIENSDCFLEGCKVCYEEERDEDLIFIGGNSRFIARDCDIKNGVIKSITLNYSKYDRDRANIFFENCHIHNVKSTVMEFDASSVVEIRNCLIHDIEGCAIKIEEDADVSVSDSSFYNISDDFVNVSSSFDCDLLNCKTRYYDEERDLTEDDVVYSRGCKSEDEQSSCDSHSSDDGDNEAENEENHDIFEIDDDNLLCHYYGNEKEVTIPSGVTKICSNVFNNCLTAEIINVPETVEEIEAEAFIGCDNLKTVNISEDNENYIFQDGFIFTKDKSEVVRCICQNEKVVVPEGIKSLSWHAFEKCQKIKEVVLPEGIEEIGGCCFEECCMLEKINLPNSIQDIYGWVFRGCKKLKNIILPDELTFIYNESFKNCTSLTDIVFPKSLEHISMEAFEGCTSLKNVELPECFKSMKDMPLTKNSYTFNNCTSLETVIMHNLDELGDYVFDGCTSLKSIEIDGYCDFYTMDGVLYNEQHTLLKLPSAKEGSVTLDDDLSNIDNHGLQNLTSIESFEISDENMNYCTENGVLYNKSKTELFRVPNTIEEVKLPESLEDIKIQALYNCYNVKEIFIPKNVSRIGEDAFSNCSSLQSFSVDEDNMYFASVSGLLCNKLKKAIIKVPDGITSLTIPDSIAKIRAGAFSNCKDLKDVYIPESVKNIHNSNFSNCNVTIHGKSGSAAEKFANDKNLLFVAED